MRRYSWNVWSVTGAMVIAVAGVRAEAALTWSLVADQTVISTPSEELTRSLRALALSSDESTIYAGFIQKADGSSARSYALAGNPPVGTAGVTFDVTTATVGPSGNLHQAKAVATDGRGIVYVGSSKDSTSQQNARVIVLDAALGTFKRLDLNDIDFPGTTGETVDGLWARSVGATQYLYASRHHSGSAYIERYVVGGTGVADATLTLDNTFSGDGRFNLRTEGGFPTASLLYGIEVADDGSIFVAAREDNAVYKVAGDLSTTTKVTINRAIDVALYDGRVFVTSYDGASSLISELKQSDLSVLSTFDAFAFFPRIGADGNVADTGYSGIDIDSAGRIYLADQLYLRNSSEARDRILVSSPLPPLPQVVVVPEPGSALLWMVAAAGLLRRRRCR